MINERTGPIYSANGKQLLRDTGNGPQHFADFSQAAATIALIVQGTLNPESLAQWISLFGTAMLVPAHD